MRDAAKLLKLEPYLDRTPLQLSGGPVMPALVAGPRPHAPCTPDFSNRSITESCAAASEVEQGWSLFATHPVNSDDLPFRLITGLVDADLFHDDGINFPAVWTEPNFSGVLMRGKPGRRVNTRNARRD